MTGYEKVFVTNDGDDPVLLVWREDKEKIAFYLQPGECMLAPIYAAASIKASSRLIVGDQPK